MENNPNEKNKREDGRAVEKILEQFKQEPTIGCSKLEVVRFWIYFEENLTEFAKGLT